MTKALEQGLRISRGSAVQKGEQPAHAEVHNQN
jgi:hypothetical protein